MRAPRTVTDDLVPLRERLQLMWMLRGAVAAITLVAWQAIPTTRGVGFSELTIVTAGYLGVLLGLHAAWSRFGRRSLWLLSIMLMIDSVYLAWASYGTAGMGSPLRELVLVQLIGVSLIASYRTGMKLALWNSLLLLCAYHGAELHAPGVLGGVRGHFGDATYRQVVVDIVLYWLVAGATSSFAAINERELRRRRYDLEALARLSMDLEAADEPEAVARTLAATVADTFGYGDVVVIGGSVDEPQILSAPASSRAQPHDRCPLVTRVRKGRESLLVDDVRDDALLSAALPDHRNVALLALHAEGRTVGVLAVSHALRRDSRMERRVLTMLERFAAHAALALAHAGLLEQARHNARTDALTGLANRRHLDQELGRMVAEADRTGGPLSVLMVDLDHFKAINDQHGHDVGDRVLRLAAMALAGETRAMDLPARFGGEEFCVVMPGLAGADAAAAAERVRAAIERMAAGVPVSTSIGVATRLDTSISAEALLRSADEALYVAKANGRNRVEVGSVAVPEASA